MTRTRYCSECEACERKEVATVCLSYRNDNNHFIRKKHVCSDHAEMLVSDYPDAAQRDLLPRTKEEAQAWVPLMTPNYLEIVEGRRVGMPTLDRDDPIQVAAGILSGKPVSWMTSRRRRLCLT